MLTHIHIWNDVQGCTNVAEGMDKDCSRQSFCIPTIPGGHAESDAGENS